MDRGRSTILKGSADLTVAGEQIRMANAALQLQDGAELLFSGSLDVGKGAVDARMTLAGRPAANPLTGAKPELSVTLKGPIAAPERTVDVSTLLGWLTLRSTELQTRRLQALEANGRPDIAGPVVRPGSPAVRFLPLGTVLELGASTNTPAPEALGPPSAFSPPRPASSPTTRVRTPAAPAAAPPPRLRCRQRRHAPTTPPG